MSLRDFSRISGSTLSFVGYVVFFQVVSEETVS